MTEQNEITVEELRVERMKQRISELVADYETRLIEMSLERDVIKSQAMKERNAFNEEKDVLLKQIEGLQNELKELRELNAPAPEPEVVTETGDKVT